MPEAEQWQLENLQMDWIVDCFADWFENYPADCSADPDWLNLCLAKRFQAGKVIPGLELWNLSSQDYGKNCSMRLQNIHPLSLKVVYNSDKLHLSPSDPPGKMDKDWGAPHRWSAALAGLTAL